MKNAKIFFLLKTLSEREILQFKEFIRTPLLNTNKKLIQFGQCILAFYPDFNGEDFTKEYFYLQIYGKDTYQASRINNLLSDLLQLLYSFLAFQEFQSQKTIQNNLLIQNLLKRSNSYHIDKQLQKWKHQHHKKTIQNHAFFWETYLLHDQQDVFFLQQAKRGYNEHLQLKQEALTRYTLCEQLMMACDMANRNVTMNANYDYAFIFQYVEDFIGLEELKQYPVLNIYYQTLLMLHYSTEEEYFKDLKELLKTHIHLLPKNELSNLYGYCLNFCVRQINSGASAYYREIFDLYQLLIAQEIIFEDGYLSERNFRNIITVGIRMNDFEWTEAFIHQYKLFLKPSIRENASLFNLASFYYAQKKYNEALLQLQDVEFIDSFYHIGAKIIQLKSYYELDEDEVLFSLIEALKQYINRNKELSVYHKNANLQFLKSLKKIKQLKHNKGILSKSTWGKKHKTLSDSLQSMQALTNKEWILDKLEEMN